MGTFLAATGMAGWCVRSFLPWFCFDILRADKNSDNVCIRHQYSLGLRADLIVRESQWVFSRPVRLTVLSGTLLPCQLAWFLWLLTLMLLVANLANTKWCKKPEKWPKPWQMGTHLRVLSESFQMNTNLTGFRWFSKIFAFLYLGWK